MTAVVNPGSNPYEQLIGVDPRVLDAIDEERLRSDYVIDSNFITANPQFVMHALARAGEKLRAGVSADKSYIDGMTDMLGALVKISASRAELGGLLLDNS